MANRHYIRSFSRYQALARRTQNPSLTQQERLCHAALGLCAEVEELRTAFLQYRNGLADTDQVSKEAGDVMWMLAELCDAVGVNMDNTLCPSNLKLAQHVYKNGKKEYSGPTPVTKWKALNDLPDIVAVAAGCVQKTFQGHPIDQTQISYVIPFVFVFVSKLAKYCGFTMYQAMYQNIEKLKERYPEGFSAEKSLHRKEYVNE